MRDQRASNKSVSRFAVNGRAKTACVFSLGFVYLFLGIFQPLFLYDEGFVIHGAERVAGGAVPYRDFLAYYAPAQLYTLAGVFRVFGFSILAERIWDTLVRFGVCVFVFINHSRNSNR